MTRTQTNPEQDQRLALLNTLLTTPHRRLDEIHPVHAEMVKSDPRFYVRLGAWYGDTGDVRDHKEMFAITLILSDFPGHRDVGLAMLRGRSMQARLPFGTFLALAAFGASLFGERLLNWYMSMYQIKARDPASQLPTDPRRTCTRRD